MANKIDISIVTDALRLAKVAPEVVTTVIKTINEIAAEEAAIKDEKAPKAKMQTVILISDPTNKLAAAGIGDLTGWAIQMEQEGDPANLIDRLKEGTLVFNRSPKGRKYPSKGLGESIHVLTPKHLKDEAHPERKVKILTKDIVQAIITDGQL